MNEKTVKSAVNVSEVMSHVDVNRAYKSVGHTDQAMDSFKQALGLDKDCTPALLEMSLIISEQHGPVRAAREYVKSGPEDAKPEHVFTNIAATHMEEKNWKGALTVLHQGLESGASCWRMYHNLGTCLRYLGRPEDAEDALRCASRLNSETPESILELAEILQARGRRFRATKLYCEVCRKFHTAEAYTSAALGLFQLGRFRLAIKAGTNAVLLNPSEFTSQLVVGMSHMKLLQYQAAKEPLWQAMWIDRCNPLPVR